MTRLLKGLSVLLMGLGALGGPIAPAFKAGDLAPKAEPEDAAMVISRILARDAAPEDESEDANAIIVVLRIVARDGEELTKRTYVPDAQPEDAAMVISRILARDYSPNAQPEDAAMVITRVLARDYSPNAQPEDAAMVITRVLARDYSPNAQPEDAAMVITRVLARDVAPEDESEDANAIIVVLRIVARDEAQALTKRDYSPNAQPEDAAMVITRVLARAADPEDESEDANAIIVVLRIVARDEAEALSKRSDSRVIARDVEDDQSEDANAIIVVLRIVARDEVQALTKRGYSPNAQPEDAAMVITRVLARDADPEDESEDANAIIVVLRIVARDEAETLSKRSDSPNAAPEEDESEDANAIIVVLRIVARDGEDVLAKRDGAYTDLIKKADPKKVLGRRSMMGRRSDMGSRVASAYDEEILKALNNPEAILGKKFVPKKKQN
ncbi:hypothetical protein OQA88_10021 [Cercophora sp. LCS_1]